MTDDPELERLQQNLDRAIGRELAAHARALALVPLEAAFRKRLAAAPSGSRRDSDERTIARTALLLIVRVRLLEAQLHIATCNDVPCLQCNAARKVLA